MRSMSLFVPIYGTGDGVRLPLDQLPDDVIAVVDVLRAEAAPLGLWLQLAVGRVVVCVVLVGLSCLRPGGILQTRHGDAVRYAAGGGHSRR